MSSLAGGDAAMPRNPALTVLPTVLLAMGIAVSDQAMVATALPGLIGELGGVELISWVFVATLMTSTLAAPVYGRLGDMLGRRRMLVLALCLFVCGAALCALAWRIEALIAARAFQGIGAGGLMTLSQALIGQTVPPRERGRFQGYIAAMQLCATTAGPILGGLVAHFLGWRLVFVISLPAVVLALGLSVLLPKGQPADKREPFDLPGLVFFAASVVPVLLSIHFLKRFDAASLPLALTLFGGAACALALLVRRERIAPAPLFPVELMRQAAIWRCDLIAACHGASMIALVAFVPIYLRAAKGMGAAEIGLMLLALTGGAGIGTMATGRMVTRTGRTMLFPSLGLSLGGATVLMLGLASPHLGALHLPWVLAWFSICGGTVMGVLQIVVQHTAGPKHIGAAAGTVQFSRSLGGAIGTSIVGAALFAALSASDPEAARVFVDMLTSGPGVLDELAETQRARVQAGVADAFLAAFLVVVGFQWIGAALAWSVPSRRI